MSLHPSDMSDDGKAMLQIATTLIATLTCAGVLWLANEVTELGKDVAVLKDQTEDRFTGAEASATQAGNRRVQELHSTELADHEVRIRALEARDRRREQ